MVSGLNVLSVLDVTLCLDRPGGSQGRAEVRPGIGAKGHWRSGERQVLDVGDLLNMAL